MKNIAIKIYYQRTFLNHLDWKIFQKSNRKNRNYRILRPKPQQQINNVQTTTETTPSPPGIENIKTI